MQCLFPSSPVEPNHSSFSLHFENIKLTIIIMPFVTIGAAAMSLVGFGKAGVAAGSAAAGIQSGVRHIKWKTELVLDIKVNRK